MFQIGQVLRNTYRIERQIGKGGMGTVYEAAHLRLARRFAVKALYPDVKDNTEALERFRREAIFTSTLGHRHIVEIIDFAHTEEGIPYLVMEMLEGESLDEQIKRRQKLSLTRATAIFRQAAQALQAAHSKGIVHRDLKPSNIYLCRRENQDNFVKVLDFGVSKMLGMQSSLTQSNHLLGTPFYMSPEQADEKTNKIDQRADIYAMGTILFEMLSGTLPFIGSSIPSVLYKIVHHEVPSLRTIEPDIPEALDQVIQRSMHKQPQERFTSMEAFWRALAEALSLGDPELEPRLEPDLSRETDLHSVISTKVLADTLPLETNLGDDDGTTPPLGVDSVADGGSASLANAAMTHDASGRHPSGRLILLALMVLLLGGFSITTFLVGESRGPTGESAGRESAAPVSPDARTRLESPSPGDLSLRQDLTQRTDLGLRQDLDAGRRSLWLSSVPSRAKVTLGQQMIGVTPLVQVEIPTRPTTLVISKPGYYKRRLRIKAGAADHRPPPLRLVPLTRRTAKPAPPLKPATLRIAGFPPAHVLLNGQDIGQAPLVKRGLKPGAYLIKVHRPGYKSREHRIYLGAGAKEKLIINLERAP